MHRLRLRPLLRPVTAAALATFAVATAAGAASPAAFSDPVRIAMGAYVDLDAATDKEGHRHIVAETAKGSIVYVTDRTGSVTTRTVAPAVPGAFVFNDPAIAVDGKGRVHMVFVRTFAEGVDCGVCSAGVMLATDRGRARGTFGTPTQIARSGAFAPDIAIRSGKRFIAFVTGMDGLVADPGVLWLKTDVSGAWTTKKAATGLDGLGWPSPSIVVTSDRRARIAFEDGPIKVAFASTSTGGFTVDTVTGTNGNDHAPVLLLNPSEGPLVLFSSDRAGTADDGVFLRGKAGASWAGVKVTPRLGAFDAAILGGTVVVAVGGTTSATAGVWSFQGPSFAEETVASVRVNDVALADVSDLVFARPSLPKGIYLAKD